MKKKGVIRRLFKYMGKFKITMVFSILCAAISAVLNLSAYICVYNVVKEIVRSSGNFSMLNQHYLAGLGWQAVFRISISFGLYGIALLTSHITAFYTVAELRVILIEHIGNLPLGYHTVNPSGKQRKIIEKNTDNLENITAHQIPDTVQSAILPVAFLVFMLIYDWRLSLICLIPIVFGFIMLAAMMFGDGPVFLSEYQKRAENISNAAVEYVRGISVVKVFGQTASSFKNYSIAVKEYSNYLVKYALTLDNKDSAYNTSINGIFFVLIPGGIILYNLGQNPEKMILSFVFFTVLIPSFVTILTRVAKSSGSLMIAEDSLATIEKILEEQPLPKTSNPQNPGNYDIALENISFSYEKDGEKVLDHLSLTMKQGTITALVGESGGGKSTIASLIARFWDVQEGAVKIGGVDVRDLDYDAWIKQVSIVFQDTNLFKMSISDNVSLFAPQASRDQILNALHLAQCDDILEKLPDGADTIIGTKGVYLSGGEMQRIALARAILKDAPVVLLDEATAFADAENEYLIQKAFNELLRGKTVLMIAHRLSTVIHADQICVLQQGKIVESGAHSVLLRKDGIYKHMFCEYQNGISWRIGGQQNA
ncbi:MAG: ABC transporter ATP-binding protein [Lachnospiraceae bacterium]